jgi:hypothetical protein
VKRIMPEEVVEAFRETKLIPTQQMYLDTVDDEGTDDLYCACGLGAIYAFEQMKMGKTLDALTNRITSIDVPTYIEKEKGLSKPYRYAFTRGFDNAPIKEALYHNMNYTPEDIEHSKQGYEDGRASYLAMQPSQ